MFKKYLAVLPLAGTVALIAAYNRDDLDRMNWSDVSLWGILQIVAAAAVLFGTIELLVYLSYKIWPGRRY